LATNLDNANVASPSAGISPTLIGVVLFDRAATTSAPVSAPYPADSAASAVGRQRA